jgi:SpoVK/Ycf46/Vps4 family AAA+-type ATPase
MLCVSGADIEHKYVGETEKAIQALFNLARMLYPSMVFIDEADSLFQSREMNLHEYSRSRINQLLAEMDGLVHHKHPPFILLATNYPRQLDHAVLRRVPSLLHLGLPSTPARGKIFEIYLRDEHLDEDVKTDSLASKTMGYSGSDIKTLCVQTALLCDTYINHKSRSVRLLKNTHFLQALNRCVPTVSRPALEEISAFAAMHDPRALESSADTETGNVCHDGIVGLSDVLRDEHFD